MRYWDASALVSLCVAEPDTGAARRLARDPIVTWNLSTLEIASAIERRTREQVLSSSERTRALAALSDLAASWTEVSALGSVRDRAVRLVAIHPLRAGGAAQLGAALVAVSDRPQGHEFVCTDRRLADAAAREGFAVLPEPID
jgi:hypothetical protein